MHLFLLYKKKQKKKKTGNKTQIPKTKCISVFKLNVTLLFVVEQCLLSS